MCNPIIYYDPTGEVWLHIGSAILSGTSSALAVWIGGETSGNNASAGTIIAAFATGAVIGIANPLAGFANAESALATLGTITLGAGAVGAAAAGGEIAKLIDEVNNGCD